MDSVLVVISYTDFKYYSRPLMPRIFNDLKYEKKELLFVNEKTFPGFTQSGTGDVICAQGRVHGIEYAKKRGLDWCLFLDIDLIPDADILTTLLATKYPFVGGVVAARGDSTKIIGHTYRNDDETDRVPLNLRGQTGVKEVDGTSGAMMMVHKSIFEKVDYTGYTGVNMYPYRTVCDDEYYCLKVRHALNIKPKINLNAGGWHLNSDGFGYRWYGQKKAFQRLKTSIIFNGRLYEQK